MRNYLAARNLGKASALGAAMTVLAVPNIMRAGVPLQFYVPVTFFLLVLLCGSITAWGNLGGMIGAFPSARRMMIGVAIALVLCVMSLPLGFQVESVVRKLLLDAGRVRLLELQQPSSVSGVLALMAWSASLQAVFFEMSAMSFLSRLTGNQYIALVSVAFLRVVFSLYWIEQQGLSDGSVALAVASSLSTVVGCLLFARTGVPGCMVWAAGANLPLLIKAMR